MFQNGKDQGIDMDMVNGYDDHCHCLFQLDVKSTVAKTIQLIKGETAHWINTLNLVYPRFEWQREYYVASVSRSHLDRVRRYIRNQEQHHKRRSFESEFDDMVKKYGFQIYQDNWE